MSVKVNETICPYCGSNLVREKRPLLGDILCCPNTPNCDAYVLVTTEPDIGIPGNSFLRSLRKRGHRYLDIICDGRMENKDALYNEMSEHLHLIGKYAHFRYMGVHDCIDAILFLIDYIAKNYHKISGGRRKLSVKQAELFMAIANMDADFDSEIYENEALLFVLQLIYQNKDFLPKKVSRRTGACTCRHLSPLGNVRSTESFFFKKKKTIRTAVHSFTDTYYNRFAKDHGYPLLKSY